MKNLKKLGKILNKNQQKMVNGGFFGCGESDECLLTGCLANIEPHRWIGFEGGPCGFERPANQSCTGIVQNGLCCVI
ncbi:hypothetical protein D7030_11345 [Flavobacteriaceae bacterium AU392]|nr:hypothetical protein D1817_13325 [Flavobacteriaceae bacterium]RKM82754.1 hypothetical protein D7030_11345 [Flavobacteriaceae bacterium AU392]